MIKKLSEPNRDLVLRFLKKDPSINIFIIGDIENFGFSQSFQEIWGSFDSKGTLRGVLLRFDKNYIPYFIHRNEEMIKEFKEIIMTDKNKKILCGRASIVDVLKDSLLKYREKIDYFCELKDTINLVEFSQDIKVATLEDGSKIYDLLSNIEEFKKSFTNTIERIEKTIKTKQGKIYYIENEEGKAISIAQTSAENSHSAMVVGVATHKDYRKQGLVSQCLSKLAFDFLKEKNILCLSYDNPKAGSVYHRLGFKNIDRWSILIEE